MEQFVITNALVYTGHRFVPREVYVEEGWVAQLAEKVNAPAGCPRLDLGGKRLVPGFIDIHTHGAAGVDVNAATAAQLNGTIGHFFASQGTTGWLCSVLTDTPEQTLWCLDQAKAAMKEAGDWAQLLGVHLEGPFLASQYKGAMPEHLLQKGSAELFARYEAAGEGAVRYMTVSPEVEGVPAMVRDIAARVKVAIGHSGAEYDTAMECIANGAVSATHTFNAMRLFHQHQPAIMGAVLESDVYCEAICDGRHLHPASVRLLLKCKGWDRVVAVTDSIMAAGLPDGNYKLGVNDVVVEDGDAKLASDGTRAGSTLTTGQALKNLVRFTGEGPEKVLPLLTENPADLLGLPRKGRIAPGCDADFVVLGEDLTVLRTIVGGRTVYTAE
ncbi:N-acetylglucosamine-6-phosphate deacetylase [Allofournierella sp.]|uniref:N-acetylglucosamine-6-phosphate deacetylase n=1 Tax=Allofournierella sp. TaxID=1940256 RepID=UPI002E768040|nr:N-acetylglucosamine-6-phosphate deacetylase [Fournierella sp.]MEE0756978.1 N-acetylglucosamine-6-phosphate deacetylase [Fournierella sp.]